MKFFIVLLFLVTLLQAQNRPKIALVLSGGGARGGAHVGVLKVLEENHVPIDMIVGTSMGSFMGGLYAAGWKPDEIEKMLVSTDWNRYIRGDFDRKDIPMQRKRAEYTYQGKLGFGINAKNEIVLPTGVFKREPLLLKFEELTANVRDIRDFDKLTIPYRAVATNIKNGDAVILKSGSLAEAIYASSAIPGGLQPIHINGIDLIDGGVSDNIPINVARNMGADIIIAVDVSEDFSDKVDVNSYFVVMGQLVDILMRKNANESIKTLKKDDILITPDLEGYGGLDVEKYAEIIQAGYKAAKKAVPDFQKLADTYNEYSAYTKKYRKKPIARPIIIDEIRIDNHTYLNDNIIRQQIHQRIGMPFDDVTLRKDILHLYNLTVFDSIVYNVKSENNKNILVITTTPSWNNHGDVLFSISLDDDFKGHSSYSLKAGYLMYGINSWGAEWRTDLEIGKKQHYATEFYQPLDYLQKFYLRPYVSYEKMTYIVPTDDLGNQELKSTSYGGGIALGANITRNLRSEISFNAFKDGSDVDIFAYDKEFESRKLSLDFQYDSLDNYNFPNVGFLGELRLSKDAKSWGGDYDYEQMYFALQKPLSFYNNTLIINAKMGLTNHKSPQNGNITVYDKFFLGGMFNLSGYPSYALVGNNVAFGSMMYRYRVKNGGFFGSLGMPMYAGLTLESGTTWSDNESFESNKLKYSGSIFFAADTPLGALYFTYGYADAHHSSLYLYLGEKF